MKFIVELYQKTIPNVKPIFVDILNMNLGYNQQCDPNIRLGQDVVKCVLNVYPKELLISEIEHDDLLKYDL